MRGRHHIPFYDVASPDLFPWPGMQKTKDQIPDSLACYMTLRGHLNFMGLISLIYKIEMTFAVSESNYNDEHTPYVVDNTC